MKFTCSVDIDKPIDEVIALFDNPDNLKEWQDGFVSIDPLDGTPGQPGAKSRLVYKVGKSNMELIETIVNKNLPEEFIAIYEHKSMVNKMTSRFTKVNEDKTRYVADLEYTEFKGIMPKLMALLMPGMFKKQTQKWLDQFKEFAEKQNKYQGSENSS